MNFYSEEQIQTIQSELKAGTKATQIARKYSKEWKRNAGSLLVKIYTIKKEVGLCKTSSKERKPANVNNKGVVLPSGFVFDFKPSRAEMHSDHVRLYF